MNGLIVSEFASTRELLKEMCVDIHGKNCNIIEKSSYELSTDAAVFEVLNKHYDFIIIPLSLPNFLSLRFAERVHICNLPTRLILCSGTLTDRSKILRLFDGFCNGANLEALREAFKSKCHRISNIQEIEAAISAILGQAKCFERPVKPTTHTGALVGVCYGQPGFDEYRLKISSIIKATSPPHEDADSTASAEIYVDFNLHIAANGRVVARSRQGEQDSNIRICPSKAIASASESIKQNHVDAHLLEEFGEQVYRWLFPSTINTLFESTVAVARNENAKVRLRLQIDANAIATLPLEFLYRKNGRYFMAVNPSIVISRYLNVPLPTAPVRRQEGSLHMLAIISAPNDQGQLSPDDWDNRIREALHGPLSNGQLNLRTVKQATRKEIRKALLEQKPNIIQFIGHGIYQDGKGHLALVADGTGKTWLVDDEKFANLFLGYDDHLGLVSLTTCESGMSDDPQGFLGIAPQLIQRIGVPAVLAMQYKVLVKTAEIFLDEFYTCIAAHKPIDWAVQAARNALATELGTDNREFATPVLYMRAQDGCIF